MNIKVENYYSDRYRLYVNWIVIWEYYWWIDKRYLNPEKRAKEMLRKRNKMLDRNIERLQLELESLKEEKTILNSLPITTPTEWTH